MLCNDTGHILRASKEAHGTGVRKLKKAEEGEYMEIKSVYISAQKRQRSNPSGMRRAKGTQGQVSILVVIWRKLPSRLHLTPFLWCRHLPSREASLLRAPTKFPLIQTEGFTRQNCSKNTVIALDVFTVSIDYIFSYLE